MEKYSTQELCEQILKITKASFKAHKQKYLAKLKLAYDVREEKIGGADYYYITPKNNFYNILQCDMGKKDIDIVEKILKVLIEGDVIPVQEELAKAVNVPRGTLKNYMQALKKRGIIMEPDIQIIVSIDENSKVIAEYEKKIVSHVYYDLKHDGTRMKLPNQDAAHRIHGLLWKDIFDNKDYLHKIKKNLNYQPLLSVLRREVWNDINSTFGLDNGGRVAEPIINPEIKQRLKEYFYQVT